MTFVATLMNSGTTATVALLRDGIELVVASVGDSRALLCRKGKAMKLTIDHTLERKEEKERYVLWLSGEWPPMGCAAIRLVLGKRLELNIAVQDGKSGTAPVKSSISISRIGDL